MLSENFRLLDVFESGSNERVVLKHVEWYSSWFLEYSRSYCSWWFWLLGFARLWWFWLLGFTRLYQALINLNSDIHLTIPLTPPSGQGLMGKNQSMNIGYIQRLVLLFIDLRVVFLRVSRVGIEPTTAHVSTLVSTPVNTPVSIVDTFTRTVKISISTVSHPLAIR